jgi:hypothetical protein
MPGRGSFRSRHVRVRDLPRIRTQFMKPVTLTAAALAIALVAGTSGYFLGKQQVSTIAPQITHTPAGGPTVSRRPSSPTLDPAEFRARLDAEENPLTRFNLALDHLEVWIGKSPVAALDWLLAQPSSGRRDDVIQEALNQFAETDAKGAAEWAASHLSGAELNNSLITIAEGWAAQNGSEAAAWFLSQPVTQERDAAVESLFFVWASNDPVAALALLKSNPNPGDLSPILLRAALAGWAKSEPQEAAAYSLAASGGGDPALFANTLANWATMDLDASSQWLLAKVPAGADRTAAAQELAGIFANQSPETGMAWLEKLSAGTERDAASSAFAATWSRRAPAQAAQWIASSASTGFSPQVVATVARNFLIKDSAAFEAWRAALPPGPLKEQVAQVGAISEDD